MRPLSIGVFLAGAVLGFLGVATFHTEAPLLGGGTGTLTQLQQFVSTTSPSAAITQATYGKAIKITGLATGNCLSLDANSFVTTAACAGGSSTFSTTSANYWASVGLSFSTTSTNYWLTQQVIAGAFSTTSANYWAAQGLGFSTTSENYYKSVTNFFSTTSATYFSSLGLAFSTTSSDYWGSTKGYLTSAITSLDGLTASTQTMSSIASGNDNNMYISITTQAGTNHRFDLGYTSPQGVRAGGTGWGNFAAGTVLYGNGTGALATTTAGTAGQVLSVVDGVPKFVSTSTIAAGTNVTLSVNGSVTTINASGAGGGSSFGKSWEVFSNAGAQWLAPTTSLGTIVSASSSIGSGLAGGGLSISGNATTTGNGIVFGSYSVTGDTTDTIPGAGRLFVRLSGCLNSSGFVMLNAGSTASARWWIDCNLNQRLDNGSNATVPIVLNGTNGAAGSGIGKVSVGSSTPLSTLSVQLNYGASHSSLFSVASSTATDGSTAATVFSIDKAGNVAVTGNLIVASSSLSTYIPPYFTKTISYASSTQGMGTTTRSAGVAPDSITVKSVQCDFNNFMRVLLYHGAGTRSDDLIASSTIGKVTYTLNTTYTAGEAMRVDIGTTTNIAANVFGSCTIKYVYN